MAKDFDRQGLRNIKESFHRINDKHSRNSTVYTHLKKFIDIIETYENNTSSINYPDILGSFREIIFELKESVSPTEVKEVAEEIKKECRLCMFHADDCFMNIFFIIFKSIEKGVILEPNRVRPTLRSI